MMHFIIWNIFSRMHFIISNIFLRINFIISIIFSRMCLIVLIVCSRMNFNILIIFSRINLIILIIFARMCFIIYFQEGRLPPALTILSRGKDESFLATCSSAGFDYFRSWPLLRLPFVLNYWGVVSPFTWYAIICNFAIHNMWCVVHDLQHEICNA